MTNRDKLILLLLSFFAFSCSGPSALFDYNQKRVEAPSEVSFENKSKNAESYSWDFGDGTESKEEMPSHRYTLSGKYEVCLTAHKGGKKSITKKEVIVEAPKICLVEMKTSLGSMTFELSDLTPKHRDNFIKLAEEGFYEGTLFHRVINGFMVQGGDPDSKNAPAGKRLGMGGPSYNVDAEFNPKLGHVKGALAAARQGDQMNPMKRSSGSQFYIVDGKEVQYAQLDHTEMQKGFEYSEDLKAEYVEKGGTPFLDQDYTVFGKLIKGFEVLDKIAEVRTDPSDRPVEDVIIEKVSVVK